MKKSRTSFWPKASGHGVVLIRTGTASVAGAEISASTGSGCPVTGPPSTRRGFILLLVLSMILVTSLMTISVARQSLQVALEAAHDWEQQQDRWARLSLQQAIQRIAQRQWLAQSPIRSPEFPEGLSGMLTLNGRGYRWALDIESAKVNLNSLYYGAGPDRVAGAIHELQPSGQVLRLQPYPCPRPEARIPVYDSWGQVFDSGPNTDLRPGEPPWLWRATQSITCWGDGRLHFRLASELQIRTLLAGVVRASVVERFLKQRQEFPEAALDQLTLGLGLSSDEDDAWRRSLTEQISHVGIWIWQSGDAGPIRPEMHIVGRRAGTQKLQIDSWRW